MNKDTITTYKVGEIIVKVAGIDRKMGADVYLFYHESDPETPISQFSIGHLVSGLDDDAIIMEEAHRLQQQLEKQRGEGEE